MFSKAEENYLKTIYALQSSSGSEISTNLIAQKMQIKASSVTVMIKKLAQKQLLVYQRYQGVSLTPEGKKTALKIIRKHRLWEYFLAEKLHFPWEEVHVIAEQLEHIKSESLIDRLDDFLGNPRFDPHGDPIPDRNNSITVKDRKPVSKMHPGERGILDAVADSSDTFLHYLNKRDIALGDSIQILEKETFDRSLLIRTKGKSIRITEKIAENLLLTPAGK